MCVVVEMGCAVLGLVRVGEGEEEEGEGGGRWEGVEAREREKVRVLEARSWGLSSGVVVEREDGRRRAQGMPGAFGEEA